MSNKIFPVVIALWFHLFPFRTEKLSTVAPMVLHTRGRVGRRHFHESLEQEIAWGSFFYLGPVAPLVLLVITFWRGRVGRRHFPGALSSLWTFFALLQTCFCTVEKGQEFPFSFLHIGKFDYLCQIIESYTIAIYKRYDKSRRLANTYRPFVEDMG